jgi:catechol 2,3-dioxygenase-like lactoylglutathione lyase family enzyme
MDHVGIRVTDLPASRRMYEASLAELGFSVLGEGEFEGDAYVLFGRGSSDDFSLRSRGLSAGVGEVRFGLNGDGASRARTGDLLGAIQNPPFPRSSPISTD